MKPINECFADSTKAAIEKHNEVLATIAQERADIKAEQAAIMADAASATGTAIQLRKRIDSIRTRGLQADLTELGELATLPELDKMARADWKAESARLRKLEAERRATLEKTADELGAAGVQRHHMIVADAVRLGYERGAADANSKSNEGILHGNDSVRIEQLKGQILAVLA